MQLLIVLHLTEARDEPQLFKTVFGNDLIQHEIEGKALLYLLYQ